VRPLHVQPSDLDGAEQVLEVQIDKGMQDKQKIVFQGEADQAPGTVPGDVVFVLQCKKHSRFIRKGDDLLMEHKVCLSLRFLRSFRIFQSFS
jgi:DnaJ family protein A protein 2